MFMRIKCGYCRQSWEVYQRDDWKADKARTCPHCGSKIDRQTWDNQLLPAFGAASDANRELYKDFTGYHVPLFTVDFIADHIFSMEQAMGLSPFAVLRLKSGEITEPVETDRAAGLCMSGEAVAVVSCNDQETREMLKELIERNADATAET